MRAASRLRKFGRRTANGLMPWKLDKNAVFSSNCVGAPAPSQLSSFI